MLILIKFILEEESSCSSRDPKAASRGQRSFRPAYRVAELLHRIFAQRMNTIKRNKISDG